MVRKHPNINKEQLQAYALLWKQTRKNEQEKNAQIIKQKRIQLLQDQAAQNSNQNLEQQAHQILNNQINLNQNQTGAILPLQSQPTDRPVLTSNKSVLSSLYRSGLTGGRYNKREINFADRLQRRFFNQNAGQRAR